MENKLEISIPEGMEIDEEKSILKEGKIVFKKKENNINTWDKFIKYRRAIAPREKFGKGYFIDIDSEIKTAICYDEADKNIFFTEKQAKSALAMSQISQLMPYFGNAITDKEWSNSEIYKYCIERLNNNISTYIYADTYQFLAFHTEEQRDRFLKYNEQLVKDYLMID